MIIYWLDNYFVLVWYMMWMIIFWDYKVRINLIQDVRFIQRSVYYRLRSRSVRRLKNEKNVINKLSFKKLFFFSSNRTNTIWINMSIICYKTRFNNRYVFNFSVSWKITVHKQQFLCCHVCHINPRKYQFIRSTIYNITDYFCKAYYIKLNFKRSSIKLAPFTSSSPHFFQYSHKHFLSFYW